MNISSYFTESPCQPQDAPAKYLEQSDLSVKWYEETLSQIPEMGWHNNLMHVARSAKRANITLAAFIEDVKKHTPGGVLAGRVCEIERAYNRCDTTAVPRKTDAVEINTDKPAPIILPDPLENETEQFLKALFEPDETIVIAPAWFNPNRQREEPQDVLRQAKTRDEWITLFSQTAPSDYFENTIGIYVKINPLTPGINPKNNLPLADDASITSYRWLLVEGDEESKEEQLGAIHAACLPYATVVDSGKKSLHALVRLDAENLDDYKTQAKEIYNEVGKLIIVDSGNSHPARYSRLPGCKRTDHWQSLLEVYSDVPSVQENNRQKWLAGSYTLAEYFYMDMPKETTLLGNRFLCREGSMLFVGPSGIGKSSACVQCDILWSLGLPAFDIKPAFPLRILCVQAENDDGDMIEMTRGIIHGLHLTDTQIHNVGQNTLYRNYKDSTGQKFLQWLEHMIQAYHPALVRIDPLQAYLGGDAIDVEVTANFCRSSLNPLLAKYQCAAIIAHHTPKTQNQKKDDWKASDWMYAGAGSADLTNWARCVIIIDPISQDLFRFVAAKRQKRIGWTDPDGNPITEKYFQHAQKGNIYWESAPIPDKQTKKQPTQQDIIAILAQEDPSFQSVLLAKANLAGIGINKARSLLVTLIHSKQVFVLPQKEAKPGRQDNLLSLSQSSQKLTPKK